MVQVKLWTTSESYGIPVDISLVILDEKCLGPDTVPSGTQPPLECEQLFDTKVHMPDVDALSIMKTAILLWRWQYMLTYEVQFATQLRNEAQ